MAKKAPLVIVHGGGREIDAALAQAAIPKHQVDGLRITDERDAAGRGGRAGRLHQHAAGRGDQRGRRAAPSG